MYKSMYMYVCVAIHITVARSIEMYKSMYMYVCVAIHITVARSIEMYKSMYMYVWLFIIAVARLIECIKVCLCTPHNVILSMVEPLCVV